MGTIFLLFLFVAYVGMNKSPNEFPPYVTHSPSPTGTKAFYTYMKEEYDEVNVWNHPPNRLSTTNDKDLLVMIEPYYVPTKEEMEQYEAFMEAGNTILLFQKNPTGMFHLKVTYSENEDVMNESDVVQINIVGENQTKYEGELLSPIRLQTSERDQILLQDNSEGVIALKKSYGDGILLVVTTPYWLMNNTILKNDHIPLILSLIKEGYGGGKILFDENIHGQSPSLLTVYPKTFLVLMLQGMIFLLLWLWYKGKRFGPIFEPREATVRYSDEGLKALATWHLRLKKTRFHHSLHIQADYVKQKLQERWGIPYQTEWIDMTDTLEKKWTSFSKEDIDSFLQGLDAVLKKENISKQEYLLWSKRLDQLRKEVEEG